MPITFGFDIAEAKVHKSKKKNEESGEKQALRELQTILSSKNRRQCDCEAQIHDLIENCLGCGRLTCEAEGSGKCFSCGNLILSPEQRERLKKHIDVMQPGTSSSRPIPSNEPRTKIIDSQFDHFTIDNSKHLKEEDRRRLKQHLEELQAQRYKRKLVLEVNIDTMEAGASSMPQIDDYEQALKDLQLDHQSYGTNESTCLLSELVQKESKCNYGFEYIEAKDPPKDKTNTNRQQNRTQRKIDPSFDKQSKPVQRRPYDPYPRNMNQTAEARSRRDPRPKTNQSKRQPTASAKQSARSKKH